MNSTCYALDDIIQAYPNVTIWIAGDVNLPDINWHNNTIISNRYNLAINSKFLDLLSNHSLSQIIDFLTRCHNILDIFFNNHIAMITSCVSYPGISDHDAILICSNTRIILPHPTYKEKTFQWHKINIDSFLSYFSSFKDTFLH